ncbi:MAG: radical SAM protein [Candidatus Eisenbacteria bacterium]|nr:radical SAM protein [Candidatus Eisenbacteria bacterium]
MPQEPHAFRLRCRSLLTRSGIPSVDYAVNPYFGCTHGCAYCYATFMLKFRDAPGPWGSFVGVKENAAFVLARELARRKPGRILFGTVCDAYQPAEAGHRVTRECLRALIGARGFGVGILTKSDLVVRDVDVLAELGQVRVGFSMTTLDDDLARLVEPGAPPPRSRLEAMRELARAGVAVWGFIAPVLPTFSDSEETLRALMVALRDAGADRVLVDTLNPYPQVRHRLWPIIARHYPDRAAAYEMYRADRAAYASALALTAANAAQSAGVVVEMCF